MNFFDRNNYRHFWKAKPSEQVGYNKCYYMDTPEGDHIEVDFNFPRQMVRISVKVAEEHGREYFSVIKSGTILQERDVTRRRAADLTAKLGKYRNYFAHLREELILSTIGGNYGYPEKPDFPGGERGEARHSGGGLFTFQRRGLYERVKRYLEKRHAEEREERPFWSRWTRRIPTEMIDLAIGLLPFGAFLFGYLKAAESATLTGFLGLSLGAVDWVWRQRDPFLPKVIFMLAISGYTVFFEIQNRMWAIFL